MKNLKFKKLFAVVLVVVMLLSTSVIGVSANNTTNLTIAAPRAGATPSYNPGRSNVLIIIYNFYWAEQAPGESMYHVMHYGDTFKSGYNYRAVFECTMNPNANVSVNHPITINGYTPTDRAGWSVYLQYDNVGIFGATVRPGGSGGSGSSGSIDSKPQHNCELYDKNYDGKCDSCGEIFTNSVKITATSEIKYKETISYGIRVNNMPAGASLVFYDPEYPGRPIIVSNAGYIGSSNATLTEQYVAMYRVVDKNGKVLKDKNQIETYYVVIDIEDSFFIRIIAFFKGLFGMNAHHDLGTYEINY